MPTYEYRCPNGHDFDQFFRKISDAPGEFACPVCGALAVRRVSGGAGLLFKGSGFYLTDYGKNAHRKAASEAGSDAKGASGDAKSGEKADAGSKSDSGSGGTTSDSGGGAKPSGGASADSKPSSGKPAGGDST